MLIHCANTLRRFNTIVLTQICQIFSFLFKCWDFKMQIFTREQYLVFKLKRDNNIMYVLLLSTEIGALLHHHVACSVFCWFLHFMQVKRQHCSVVGSISWWESGLQIAPWLHFLVTVAPASFSWYLRSQREVVFHLGLAERFGYHRSTSPHWLQELSMWGTFMFDFFFYITDSITLPLLIRT